MGNNPFARHALAAKNKFGRLGLIALGILSMAVLITVALATHGQGAKGATIAQAVDSKAVWTDTFGNTAVLHHRPAGNMASTGSCPASMPKAVWHSMGKGVAWTYITNAMARDLHVGHCARFIAFPRESYIITARGKLAGKS